MLGRLKKPALVAVATLALLEIVLQILALWVWLFYPRHDTSVSEGQRVVACLGDSFTFGEGASSHELSYPGQLQAILRAEAGPEWRVVNFGVPGHNSRMLLERIDRQLRRARPELVCILVGVNDQWSQPKELVLPPMEPAAAVAHDAATEEPWRWEYRTARLVRIFSVSSPFSPQPTVEAEAPLLVGTFGTPSGHVVRFEPDGSGAFEGRAMSWRAIGSQLELTIDGHALPARAERRDGRTTLVLDGVGSFPLMPVRGVPPGARAPGRPGATARAGDEGRLGVRDALTAHRGGEDAVAERILLSVLARVAVDSHDALQAHKVLLQIRKARADEPALEAYLDEMRATFSEHPSEVTGHVLLRALQQLGRIEEGRRTGPSLVRSYPGNARMWLALAMIHLSGDDPAAAREAIDTAVAVADETDPRLASFWQARARIYVRLDAVEAMRSVVRAHALDADEGLARVRMKQLRGRVDRGVLEAILDELAASAEQRDALLRLHDRPEEDAAGVVAVLRSHLSQLIERSRSAGAEVLLLTYPFDFPLADEVRAVAQQHGVGVADVRRRFVELQRRDPDADYFIGDGHCNDRGYGVMAETVAARVMGRSSR